MMGYLFTYYKWISDGVFSTAVDVIKPDYPSLARLLKQVQESQMIDIVIDASNRVWHMDCMWVYEFGGLDIPVNVQTCYIDLITGCAYGDYTYKYIAGLKIVCIFDEDGLIGFVMRVKNKDEE